MTIPPRFHLEIDSVVSRGLVQGPSHPPRVFEGVDGPVVELTYGPPNGGSQFTEFHARDMAALSVVSGWCVTESWMPPTPVTGVHVLCLSYSPARDTTPPKSPKKSTSR